MPMYFPTHEDVVNRAKQRNFRMPLEDESEDDYRMAFADFMQKIDMVEAGEIRLGRTPMGLAVEADPLTALSAIMGKSRDDMQSFMSDFFGDAK